MVSISTSWGLHQEEELFKLKDQLATRPDWYKLDMDIFTLEIK